MARLDFPDYLEHIRSESRRFRDVLADLRPRRPRARVPGLERRRPALAPRRGAVVLGARSSGPGRSAPTRTTPARSARPPTTTCSRPSTSTPPRSSPSSSRPTRPTRPGPGRPSRPSGFTFRRQAHEALIHRLDAEQTAGDVTPLDTALAADGVEEVLDVMYGASPDWGSFSPLDHRLRVDITDTGESDLGPARTLPRHRPQGRRALRRGRHHGSSTTPARSRTP